MPRSINVPWPSFFGERATHIEFIMLITSSYLMAVLLWVVRGSSLWMLLPLISVPMAWSTARGVMIQTRSVLNEALALTARLSLLYGVLLAIGLIISSK